MFLKFKLAIMCNILLNNYLGYNNIYDTFFDRNE